MSEKSLWIRFLLYAGATAVAGYFIGETSIALVEKTPLSKSAVGTVFAAVANSLPELVTAIAAVRIGAVSLAVGDVIGGDAFEVMFLCAADLFYHGSIYEAISEQDRSTGLIAMLMTGVLLLGMFRREKPVSEISASKACWCSSSTLGPRAVFPVTLRGEGLPEQRDAAPTLLWSLRAVCLSRRRSVGSACCTASGW